MSDILNNILARINPNGLGDISQMLKNPTGLFALLGIVIIILYGLSVGKTKALVSLLSVYVAYVLTVLFPFLSWLQGRVTLPTDAPIFGVLVFFVLYIVTFGVLSYAMTKHRLTLGEISLIKVVLISIVQIGLIASITASLLPTEFSERTFGPAYEFLAGQRVLWTWAVASLLILPFMRSHPHK